MDESEKMVLGNKKIKNQVLYLTCPPFLLSPNLI